MILDTVFRYGRGWLTFILFLVCSVAAAQERPSGTDIGLGNGIRFDAPDSSLGLQIGFRLQTQLFDNMQLDDETFLPVRSQPRIQLRRARLQFKGYLLKNTYSYYMQLEFDRGEFLISDAHIRWHPGKGQTIGVGQYKMFEDRQNRFSAAKLQLVERAAVSGRFTDGYDMGFYWQGSFVPEDGFGAKTYVSVSQGELLNNPTAPGGYLYNARLELLPLGSFSSGGDYTAVTLVDEPDPKLTVGLSGSYNMDAFSLYGPDFSSSIDTEILTLHVDYLFKYRHFSTMGQFAWREVENEVFNGNLSEVMGGYGFFVQSGIMAGSRVELAARYERIRPESDHALKRTFNFPTNHYSLGLNYYVNNHNMKVQTMLTLVEENNESINDRVLFLQPRLQFQINF